MTTEAFPVSMSTDDLTVRSVRAIPMTMPDILGEELNFLIVKVEVGDVVGYGEVCDSYCCTYPEAYAPLLENVLGPLVTGESADSVDLLTRRLNWYVRRRLGDHGMVKQAVSGLEIALWDAVGKIRGRSVSDLLGRAQQSVAVYASGKFLDDGPADYLYGLYEESLAHGVRTVKLRSSMDPKSDIKVLRQVRKLLGDEIDVLVDGNEHFSLFTAHRFGKALAAEGVLAFEEPVPDGFGIGSRLVKDGMPLPVAMGEHMYNEAQFIELLSRGGADVIQPDPAILGGISETLRIADSAGRYGVAVVPHSAAGPFALAAALHVAGACPNISLLEHSFTLESAWEIVVGNTVSRSQIVEGRLPVPKGPGLGLEVNEEAFEEYAFKGNRHVTLTSEGPVESVGHV